MTYQRRTARRGPRARIAVAATRGRACTTAGSFAAELLESRRLLSAGISSRVLIVSGTDATNFVVFSPTSNGRLDVFDNGVNQGRFRLTDFDRIQVNLAGGADVLQATSLKPISMDGGAGDDASGTPDRIEITATSAGETITASARRVAVGAQTYDFVNTEDVYVFGAGGNDTFRLVPVPAGQPATPTPSMTFLGNTGNDTFDAPADVPWTDTLYFEGGAGTDRLLANAAAHYDYHAGDGADTLVLPTTNASDITRIDYARATVHLAGTTVEVRGVNHDAVERIEVLAGPSGAATGATHVVEIAQVAPTLTIHVAGSADADQVNVNASAFGPTNASLTFLGNGGDDRLATQPGVNVFATYDGGAGNDALVFGGENIDDVITVDADSAADDRGVVNFTSVSQVEVRADAGNDVVNVSALPDVGFHVRGHSTSTSIPDASDRLHIDTNGGTPTAITYNPGSTTDGQVTFADRQPITFSGIRQITGLENARPTASAGGPYQVVEGKTVVLDARASRPFEGTTLTYEWDFNYDGATFDVNATGATPAFSAAGLFAPLVRTVAVRVKDAGNRTAIATSTVTMTPTQVPVAKPNGPYEVYKGGGVQLTATGSQDPDGFIAGYQWDLDYDGVTLDADSTTATPVFNAGARPAGAVVTVGLRVRDDSGIWSPVATTTVTIQLSAPPTVSPNGPLIAYEGGALALAATGTAGAGDAVLKYEWDLDYDGGTFDAQAQHGPGQPVAYAHNWDGPSTRNAAVRVTTNQGQTAIATTTIQVVNVAPQPVLTGPAVINEGQSYILQLNPGTDPGQDTISSWKIHWGDDPDVIETLPGNATSAFHIYADGPASRVINAWAVDEDGEYRAWAPVTVDTAFGSNGGWTSPAAAGTNEAFEEVLSLPSRMAMGIGLRGGNTIVFARYNEDGSLDPTFGTGGMTTHALGFTGGSGHAINAAIRQLDGKFVVAGGYNALSGGHMWVMRFNANGTPDTTFSGDGLYSRSFPWSGSAVVDLQRLADGRILLGVQASTEYDDPASTNPTYSGAFTLLMLRPDGSPDPLFGGTSPEGAGVANPTFSAYRQPTSSANLSALRVRADGTILVVGRHIRQVDPNITRSEVAMATYSATGALLDVQYRTMAGQSIVAAAFTSDSEVVLGTTFGIEFSRSVQRFSLASPTVVTATMTGNEILGDLVSMPDGSVIVAGTYHPSPTGSPGAGAMLVRMLPNGTRDANFGTGGRIVIPSGGQTGVFAAAGVTDSRVLVAGEWRNSSSTNDLFIGRFLWNDGHPLTVNNVPPSIHVSGPATAKAGEPVTINLSATDPGREDTITWRVDWGDGTFEQLSDHSYSTTATHTYALGGTRAVRVSAGDGDSLFQDAAPFSIVVANPAPTLGGDGILHVWTGDDVDNVELAVAGDAGELLRATVNGTAFDFTRSAITGIDVRLFGAADVLRIGGGVPTGSVHMGGQSTPEQLTVTGPLAGDAPLAVESFSAATFTFAPGVRANLSRGGFPIVVNLTGTDANDAWALGTTQLTGAGNAITWSSGFSAPSVRIDALGGDDTFDVETDPSGDVAKPHYTLSGGPGRDAVRLIAGRFVSGGSSGSAGGMTFLGGDDDDTLEVSGAALGFAGYAGDAGNDVLIFNGSDAVTDRFSVSDQSVSRSGDAVGVAPAFTVTNANRTTNPLPWEDARVYGHGGNDVFNLFAPLSRPKTLLEGGAGDDQFVFGGNNPAPFRSPVDLRGGDGTDSVSFNDVSLVPDNDRRYVVSDAVVEREGAARHTLGAIESVALTTSGIRDAFQITPSAATTFTINANGPTTTPGDSVRLNLAGATGATHTPGTTAGNGVYTFADRRPVSYTGVEDAHELIAPRVAGMFVGSTAWTSAYRASLAGIHPGGDAAYGYRILTADRGKTLPWSNLNQISVRFTEHVNVAADDFVLNGVNLAQYGLSTATAQAFTYDPVTFTATWTLARFIPNDKVTVRLDAAEGTGITDGSGNLLDGEPNNAVTHSALFPSGDGVAGGNFALSLRVLPGDLDRSGVVNVFDYNLLRANLNQPDKSAWGGDINGDGLVTILDLNALLANMNKTAPV